MTSIPCNEEIMLTSLCLYSFTPCANINCIKLVTRPFFIAWNRSHDVFHENMLPYICSLHDTGFKVLSMKINYLAPFKHKHNHQKFAVTKECEVANFHEQTSDGYAYVWMVPGSLFLWITLWHLCHTLNSCKVAYFQATLQLFNVWHRCQNVIHKNKLPGTIQT
jgi:hypothetical protein